MGWDEMGWDGSHVSAAQQKRIEGRYMPLHAVTCRYMPLQVSATQQKRIEDYIAIGKAEGAEVLTGGSVNDVVPGGETAARRRAELPRETAS